MTRINTQDIEDFTSKIYDKNISYIFENNSLWLSKGDLANIFKIDISDLTYYIHEYFFDSSFNIDSNIQNVYDSKTDNYISFLKLDFIISIGYRLKLFKEVKEIINLNRNIKLSFNKPVLVSQDNDIEYKIKAVEKAIELIKYIKSHDRLVYS